MSGARLRLQRLSTALVDSMFSLPEDQHAVLNVSGSVASAVLNRPAALNALTLRMIRKLHPALDAWEADDSVKCILVRGVGPKAFCAGGDVRALFDEKINSEDKSNVLRDAFFREEYALNYRIATLKTPYVALIDGITMGGGVGLSVHGKYRIATEKTMFAMPETGLGLFPDVGGSYFLPRLKNNLGIYLALTGARLTGVDVFHAGIATHYIKSDKLRQVLDDLHKGLPVQEVLDSHHTVEPPVNKDLLEKQIEFISRKFSADSVEDLIENLKSDSSEFSKTVVGVLTKMSPSSVKVTFEQLKRGKKLSLKDCLVMEFRMTQHFMSNHDFYEGVRAILVDKDRNPKWNPASLDALSSEQVQKYFDPIPNDLVLP